MKEKLYKIVEKGSHGKSMNQTFDFVILTLILLSVLSMILESIDGLNSDLLWKINIFDIIAVAIFTIEYVIRIYISGLTHESENKFKSALKFIFSPLGLIDLFAIIPFYLPMLIVLDLRFLRILRLTRFLRILKLNRYNDSLNLIWTVIKEKKSELAVTGFVSFLILLIASFIMYYVEGEKQPDQFPNIVASFWWAIATLTTVGYGDVYPITGIGKVISGLIAVMGIGLVALPTGLISAGFMNKIEKKNNNGLKCPHCGKDIE